MVFSKNLALLTFLYFIQGLPYGFQAKFLPILLRSEGISLTSVGLFKFLLAPWLCKALWAPLIDKYKTKRIWLMYSVFGLIITCLFATLISPKQLVLLSIVLFSLNFWAATQDIAVDGIAVRLLRRDELGQGNTVQVVGYKIGSIFGGGVLVLFLDSIGWAGLFGFLALLYFEAWMFAYVSPLLQSLDKEELEERAKKLDEASPDDVHDFGDIEVEEMENEDIGGEGLDNRLVSGDVNTGDINRRQASDAGLTAERKQPLTQRMYENVSDCGRILKDVWKTQGTQWMSLYVLLYKLGEQGVLGMLPLYLIDKNISANDVTFWTGVVGQGASIFGSILAGFLLTKFPVRLAVTETCRLRLVPMGIILWTLGLWNAESANNNPVYYAAMVSYILLTTLSGVVTTATFTAMMQCTKQAPVRIQATHYTTLATLEVFGKLTLASVSGWLVDLCGYTPVFLLFVLLTAAILPLFKFYPQELKEWDDLDRCAKVIEEDSEEGSEGDDDEAVEDNVDDIDDNEDDYRRGVPPDEDVVYVRDQIRQHESHPFEELANNMLFPRDTSQVDMLLYREKKFSSFEDHQIPDTESEIPYLARGQGRGVALRNRAHVAIGRGLGNHLPNQNQAVLGRGYGRDNNLANQNQGAVGGDIGQEDNIPNQDPGAGENAAHLNAQNHDVGFQDADVPQINEELDLAAINQEVDIQVSNEAKVAVNRNKLVAQNAVKMRNANVAELNAF